MTTIELPTTAPETPWAPPRLDEGGLVAASFLAWHSGRTFEACRHDRRGYFQWAADNDIEVLAATRGHIELFRSASVSTTRQT